MARPDFLVVGSMKCGTSTLAAQLSEQPGIFMASTDEINFFSDDQNYVKGLSWYESLFEAADPDDLKGEVSTHYTKMPSYPNCVSRLKEALPNVKIIYLIRNPIDRAVSHYIHEWTMGNMHGNINDAFSEYPELVSYGCYARQIYPYVKEFGEENIFLTNLETMSTRPQLVLEEISKFLNFTRNINWKFQIPQKNVSSERIRRFPLHDILFDNTIATGVRRALVPRAVRGRIKSWRQMQHRPELNLDTLAQLEKCFADDYHELRKILPYTEDVIESYPFL